MTDILEIDGVTKAFGGNTVLDDVSVSMHADALAVVGPNGAGKTTLLNVVAGLVRPDRGVVRFKGVTLTRMPAARIVHLGMVKTYQVVRPFRTLTVEEHLRLFSRVRPGADVGAILEMTGLSGVRLRYPTELPFGFLKRLELAKALAVRPELILLDEPIGGLSRAEADGILATLRTLKASGLRMVIVEHRLMETLSFVDGVVALDKGRLIFDGTPSAFFADPAVRDAYLGGAHAGG